MEHRTMCHNIQATFQAPFSIAFYFEGQQAIF